MPTLPAQGRSGEYPRFCVPLLKWEHKREAVLTVAAETVRSVKSVEAAATESKPEDKPSVGGEVEEGAGASNGVATVSCSERGQLTPAYHHCHAAV